MRKDDNSKTTKRRNEKMETNLPRKTIGNKLNSKQEIAHEEIPTAQQKSQILLVVVTPLIVEKILGRQEIFY